MIISSRKNRHNTSTHGKQEEKQEEPSKGGQAWHTPTNRQTNKIPFDT